jgi:hypothetical protein
VTNAVQLIGHFMILNGDEEMFLTFLTECGVKAQHARVRRTVGGKKGM